MNQILIFSKNRACQLHLCLESLFENNRMFDVVKVLYAHDANHSDSYQLLMSRFPKVKFIKETDFRSQVLNELAEDFKYTSFGVDDAVFYVKNLTSMVQLDSQTICFSLRLGLNCTYSHPANMNFQIKNYTQDGILVSFKINEQQGDFAYPLSTDGHIFDTEIMREMLTRIPFRNPNTLEANWQSQLGAVSHYNVMCYAKSHLVSVPVNLVNDCVPNRHALEYTFTSEQLKNLYMNNQIIDFHGMDFSSVNGAHKELNYVFKEY